MALVDFDRQQQQRLCAVLWSWKSCGQCDGVERCERAGCPTARVQHLGAYLVHVKSLIQFYGSNGFWRLSTLETFDHLLRAIETVKSNATEKRHELAPKIVAGRLAASQPADREVALNLVVRVMFMVNCAKQEESLSALERAQYSVPWRSDASLAEFIDSIFPCAAEATDSKDEYSDEFEDVVKATLLKKVAKLRLQPTDNLRDHLKLNAKDGVVEVFHHVAFLKEQLRASMHLESGCSTAKSLKHGTLPRRLVLETLSTIQKLLFPQDDPKSRQLLRSLCNTQHFDRDCLRYEWSAIRHASERNLAYGYWLERLDLLRDQVESPRPTGILEHWLERRSAPRYVMLATLAGVLVAVLLGAAALAVTSYQTWITYNAWKHPVASSSS